MKKFLPYVLPVLTIVIISSILFINPTITGFAVANQFNIEVSTSNGFFVPEDSLVVVSLNNKKTEMPIEEFISKSGGKYELTDDGFTGDYTYLLNLDEFGLEFDEGILIVEVMHDGNLISHYEKEIIF